MNRIDHTSFLDAPLSFECSHPTEVDATGVRPVALGICHRAPLASVLGEELLLRRRCGSRTQQKALNVWTFQEVSINSLLVYICNTNIH